MRPTNADKTEPPVEARLRTMRIVWAALFLAVWLYALIGYFAGPMSGQRPSGGRPGLLLPLLVLLGVVSVLASIVVRRAYARRAEAERRPGLLQSGLVVCAALCEVAALCGLVGLFVTGDSYSYVLFFVAAAGLALHFPRRSQLLAAAPGGYAGLGGFGR
jgi:F0F1-type ATP synthase membrane subunit c/vacuolar-type H+-ATPase subunit K